MVVLVRFLKKIKRFLASFFPVVCIFSLLYRLYLNIQSLSHLPGFSQVYKVIRWIIELLF